MKKLFILSLAFFCFQQLNAQQKNSWNAHTGEGPITKDKSVLRLSFPKTFRLFDLDQPEIRKQLFEVVENRVRHTSIITIPGADGQFEEFEVVEASNFEPALQARFPEIRAFSGRGITDRYASIKLSYDPGGVQGMIFRTDKPNEFIEAYSADHSVYAVFRSQRDLSQLPWRCTTPEEKLEVSLNDQVSGMQLAGRSGANLKTLRLAQSCNGEYSNYFGATSSAQESLVVAAFNATLTRCNGVYEKDLALHLNLISNTTSVIYYNPSTDPYTTMSSWNSQLQTTLTNVIGEANYDIGHMFGASGGGGNAGCIGCICVNGSKGSGITSPADGIPRGDNFDIDYVVHEVGHQLGANHTFSYSNEGSGVNKEPGSGITIMGYAGITSQDLASHSIDIYHQASIAQIQANLATKTCPATYSITSANSTPVVNTLTNYTIPISTPFALTGSATDADGDPLTYCWEQNDNASSSQTGASSVASATKATGPNWISFSPSTSPTRYFPKLATILSGALISGPLTGGDAGANTEALSSVARTLNFRLTVRDNAPYSSTTPYEVGQSDFKDVVITVSNTSGPFSVTAPNTAVTWAGGSSQTVTWNVANTTLTPVSCANVKILLSTDGGNTFPTVLIASTPNDGTESVVIPTTPSTTARIKIEAVGNIFFDISNTNFTIGAAVACGTPTGLASSGIGNDSATVSWTAVSGALSYAVDYKLNSSTTWISAATALTATSIKLTTLTSSSLYDWRVRATCSAGAGSYASAQFTTLTPFVCAAPTGLNATSITATGATITWSAVTGAASYNVDYKVATDTAWISAATGNTTRSVTLSGLTASTLYNYRVKTNCSDVNSPTSSYASAQFTSAAPFACTAPTGLNATSITATGATLTWSAVTGAASYNVDYKASSSTTWISAATGNTSRSVTISGLTASTLYDYRVMTNCTDANSPTSSYASAQFTSAAPFTCAAPTGLTSSSITATGATLTWTAVTGAASYNVDYKAATSTTWISAAVSNTSRSVTLTGLTATTTYDYRVMTNCSDTTSPTSGFASAQFTTISSSCLTAFEPNETTSAAAAISSGIAVSAAINTSTDIDYFKITTTATNDIVYKLIGPSGVDFDINIYNSANSIVGSGTGSTATETVTLTGQAAGTYYIQVFGYGGAFSTTCYTLTATASVPTTSTCRSSYDNTTNNSLSGAAVIPFNTDIKGLIEAAKDSDNYKFTITTGGTITITLGTLPADYDLRLLSSTGATLQTSQNGNTIGETINYTVTPGTYYAKVYSYNSSYSNTTSCYTLKVALGTATRITEESIDVFPNPVTSVLNINMKGISPGSVLDVINAQGSRVMSFTVSGTNRAVDVSALLPGIYLVRTKNGQSVRFVKQ